MRHQCRFHLEVKNCFLSTSNYSIWLCAHLLCEYTTSWMTKIVHIFETIFRLGWHWLDQGRSKRWHRFGLQCLIKLEQTGAGRYLRHGKKSTIQTDERNIDQTTRIWLYSHDHLRRRSNFESEYMFFILLYCFDFVSSFVSFLQSKTNCFDPNNKLFTF